MKNYFKLLFYIKRRQPLRNGNFSIICRITIDGKCCTFCTQLTTPISNWDQRSQRLTGRSPHSCGTNRLLDEIRFSLHDIYLKLLRTTEPATPQAVRRLFHDGGCGGEGLIANFRRHNEEFAQMVGTTRRSSTLYKYRYVCNHLQRYLAACHNVEEIPIHLVDSAFIHGFHRYLSEEQCSVNTIKVYMTAFKHIMAIATDNGILRRNPFSGYRLQCEPSKRYFLLKEELQRLVRYTPATDSAATILDAFLFSCFTGLAYADIARLSMKDVVSVGSRRYISTRRTKTGSAVNVPLMHCSSRLLRKYDRGDGEVLFALPSNSRCNAVLRQIMPQVGIKKRITFHSARHTFATTITLANGVPIETVSSMLGHTDIKTTQIYAKVLRTTMAQQMQRAEKSIGAYYEMEV